MEFNDLIRYRVSIRIYDS